MTYVFVHGATFAGSCWDLLLPHLDGPAIAVDLPGRGANPADLTTLTIRDFVECVVNEIERRDLHDVVLVGHSLAGITLPGVAARIPERLARLVFVGATVPAHGQTVLEALDAATQEVAAESMVGEQVAAPEDWARTAFCNDMDDDQTAWTLSHMGPEAMGVMMEPVDLQGLDTAVPRTWILTLHDAVVDTERQLLYADRVRAEIIELDAAHMAMISQPARLAQALSSLAGAR